MGCVHGKCCSRYPPSSTDSDNLNPQIVGPYNNTHMNLITQRSLEVVSIPSHGYRLEYSVLTQRGYYPDSPDKENQDSYCIKTQLQDNADIHFFGVFDGHGQFGTQCANFVKDRLVQLLANDPFLPDNPVKAFNLAFPMVNEELHNSGIDDTMSGTTAIAVLLIGDTIHIANVGDSRAVIAVKYGNRIVAENLSNDQTPFRKDECERVKLCGARVLSVDQVEGLKDPKNQSWGDEESHGSDPPRLWVQNGMYPGTAFTRSVGDSTAEKIGVVAEPEVSTVQLTPNHLFFVIASDGVFEFLSSQTVVDMAARYSDPRDACAIIASESYKLWLEHESRTDDITIIILQIKGLSNSGGSATDGNSGAVARLTGLRSRRQPSDSGLEIFSSVRSESSEIHPSCQNIGSTNWRPSIVVPSPSHKRPVEIVLLYITTSAQVNKLDLSSSNQICPVKEEATCTMTTTTTPVEKKEEEWKAILSPEQFRILRQKGTELMLKVGNFYVISVSMAKVRSFETGLSKIQYLHHMMPVLDADHIVVNIELFNSRSNLMALMARGTGEYDKFFADGVYKCAGCGTPLYKSTTKFNSGCGWPAFFEGLPGAINRFPDPDGRRIEITCAACGGHLGHVFKGEGFKTPTDERHCVNSVSIKFDSAVNAAAL
ncbi:hypothetical protein ACFE04_016226 [Oxalis oulophora]